MYVYTYMQVCMDIHTNTYMHICIYMIYMYEGSGTQRFYRNCGEPNIFMYKQRATYSDSLIFKARRAR